MKVLGFVHLAVVLSLIFNQTLALAADGSTTTDALSNASSSRNVMLESMNDPIANKAFHDIQLQLLQTPSDAMVYEYFKNNPLFQDLYSFLIKNNDALLLGFEMQAKAGMVQAVRGLTPKYDLIDKLVVEVATSLGFTEEAIRNRQIYILGGDENAFTVSGSQNKIIVAFQRGILRTMKRSEIAAVLAHELGHIRAEHTVKGIMNSIMLEMIGELFVNGKIVVAPQDANVTKSRLSDIECFGCGHNHLDHITNAAAKTGGLPTFDLFGTQAESFNLRLDSKTEKLGFIDQEIQQFVMKFASLPRPKLQRAIASYLNLLIQVAQSEHAPVQSIQYFATLLHNVGHIGTFRVNIQEYIGHAKMLEFAISRAKEKTADQISAATVRNEHLASSFAKLIGLDFDKEYRPQIFEQIKKQAVEILNTVPTQQLSSYVGTSHPSLVLRINNMLNYPAYPSVLFANNYLRLLLLNDGLVNAEANAHAYLRAFEENAKESLANIEGRVVGANGGKATPEEIAQIKAAAEKEVADTRAAIQKQIVDITASQRKHEKRVFSLLFSEDFRADADRAPRMDNTIQYFSIQREMLFYSADKIQKRRAELIKTKAVDPREIAQIDNELQQLEMTYNSILKTLELQSTLISRVKGRLETELGKSINRDQYRNLSKRVTMLNHIANAESSSELETLRAKVTVGNPNVRDQSKYRSNKIPVKMNAEVIYSPAFLTCSKLFN